MEIRTIPLDRVQDAKRLRPVDADWVALLADRIAADGLLQPIAVRAEQADGTFPLIAGGHRVAAAQLLGWDKVDAIVTEATGLQAELMEVDENLMRRELSALDRAVFLSRRKAIYEALNPTTKRGGSRASEQSDKLVSLPPAFRSETAERLGLDERSVSRLIRRAELVRDNPDLHLALSRSPVADSGAELDRLLDHPADTRGRLIAALIREEKPARSVAGAIAEVVGPPATTKAAEINAQFERLMTAWRKAGHAKARRMFLDELVEQGVVVLPAKADAA